jgi:hypothetical protein
MGASDFTPINARQRKYLEARVEGLTKTDAKRAAGYAESTQPSAIENSSLKAAFTRLACKALPPEHLVNRLKEGVDATKTIPLGEGATTDVVDFKERREYLKMAAEYCGYVEPNAKTQNQVPIEVNIKFIGAKSETRNSPATKTAITVESLG